MTDTATRAASLTERESLALVRRLAHDALAFRGRLVVAVASVAGLALSQFALTWLIGLWAERVFRELSDAARLEEELR